jgi:predicted amidohydrolase YtcJ
MTDATLLTGGRIFTGRGYCEALLLEDGKVVVAGAESEARRAAPTGTDHRDLAGDLVIPGLIDAHFHVADVTRTRSSVILTTATSVETVVAAVRRWGSEHPVGPIWGRGWDAEKFADRRWPTARDIDGAVSDRPVVLVHVSGHALVVNSATLAAAGVDRSTPDPPGGRLGRDPGGNPDGRIFEGAVRWLGGRLGAEDVPGPDALRRTLEWTASLGLTTVGAMSASPEEAIALRELSRAGRLPGRVRVYLHGGRWEEYFRAPAGPSGPVGRFSVVGVKEFTDGAFGTRTAWLSEPYADDPQNSGMAVAEDDRLRSLLEALPARGLAPALHAIGDRAVAYALRLLESFPKSTGAPPRIEHASLTPPSLFPALATVRPALVVQPGFLWSDHWLDGRLGRERARWAYVFRSLQDQGHLLAGSSDAPYDPVDPWRGIRASVERTDSEGRSANPTPAESLGPEEAIRLYTGNGGAVLGEPALGVLERDAPADLVFVRARSLAQAIGLGSGAVRETWVAGVRVAGDGNPRYQQTV